MGHFKCLYQSVSPQLNRLQAWYLDQSYLDQSVSWPVGLTSRYCQQNIDWQHRHQQADRQHHHQQHRYRVALLSFTGLVSSTDTLTGVNVNRPGWEVYCHPLQDETGVIVNRTGWEEYRYQQTGCCRQELSSTEQVERSIVTHFRMTAVSSTGLCWQEYCVIINWTGSTCVIVTWNREYLCYR